MDSIQQATCSGVVQVEVYRPWCPLNKGIARQKILGNGIVWDGQGNIVTVADLAQPGDTIRVIEGGRSVAARFIAQDPDLGISVIRASSGLDLQAIPRSAATRAGVSARTDTPPPIDNGAWVLVQGIDPPDGSEHLSIARVARVVEGSAGPRLRLVGSASPGLAGGAVLDDVGRVLGMLLGEGRESLLLTAESGGRPFEYGLQGGGPSEAGWFLPMSAIAPSVANLLVSPSRTGFLGVRVALPGGESGPPSDQEQDVIVAGVLPGSPAEAAGIREGDRIVNLQGRRVASWAQLTRDVAAIEPEQTVTLDVLRKGKPLSLQVRLSDRGHTIWLRRYLNRTGGREKVLRQQIQGLQTQLELLRHQILSSQADR